MQKVYLKSLQVPTVAQLDQRRLGNAGSLPGTAPWVG